MLNTCAGDGSASTIGISLTLVVVLSLLGGCATRNDERLLTVGGVAPSECASEVKAFLEKRFAQLRGLPAACRLDDVATELGGRAAPDGGWLGEQGRQASFRAAVVPGYADPIRVWYDQGALLMLYADFPEPPGGWTALRAALGTPEAKLDYRWDVVTVAGGEWVYPSRGLSVFLTPSLDRVVQIADFTPTSLTAYRRSLRPMSEVEEFPLPAGSDQ